jgi:mRNA-degrading endonuclease toxin of MazEF toxin-antitoxin module
MPYEYGQIILVPVADGHGNVKPHPAVIISRSDEIVPGATVRVVCVSSQLEAPSPTYHVPLPWQRPRHPRTGLNKPNVAKCNWLARVDQSDVIRVLGFAPAGHLATIEQELKTLRAASGLE